MPEFSPRSQAPTLAAGTLPLAVWLMSGVREFCGVGPQLERRRLWGGGGLTEGRASGLA